TAVTWVFFDARFPSWLLRHLAHASRVPDWAELLHWLDARLLLLGGLVMVAIAANIVVAFRLFAGRAGGRSVSSLLAATALVALWLSFFVSFEELELRGFKFRLSRKVPQLRSLFEQLRDDWPTKGV